MEKTYLTPYQPEPFAIWNWRIIIWALAFTLAIFMFLPFAELITMGTQSRLSLRKIDITEFTRVPPPPKKLPIERPKTAKPKLPKPRLVQIRQQLTPLQIALGLDLDISGIPGDFSLNFGLKPTLQMGSDELIFELSEVDQAPQPLVQIPPLYPPAAKSAGIEGRVELIFIVRADGTVNNIEVVSSTPGTIFVNSAVRSIRQWRFKPGTKDGRKVATRVWLPLKFQIESD